MRGLGATVWVVVALALAAPAGAVTVTEFPIDGNGPTAPHEPFYITTAPDGTIWFSDTVGQGAVRQMGLNGQPMVGVDAFDPVNLGFDSAGNLWWVQSGPGNPRVIGRRSPSGTVVFSQNNGTGYALGFNAAGNVRWSSDPAAGHWGVCSFDIENDPTEEGSCTGVVDGSRITGLTLGSDGRLWAVAPEADKLFKLGANDAPDGPPVTFPTGALPARAALGPDGNLWVATFGANRIYRVTPSGDKDFFQLPDGRGPNDITLGPDGALWFTEFSSNSIGRLTTDLQYKSTPVPTADAHPYSITTGGDGALWFTEGGAPKIGRLELDRPGGGGGGGGVSDATAPLFLRGIEFVPARFRSGSRSLAVNGRTSGKRKAPPIGSSLRFTLSEPATVTISIKRRARGRRVNGRCVRATRARRHRPRCNRYVAAATLTRKVAQGRTAIPFSGRIAGNKLRAGRYRAAARAQDAAGNRSKRSSAGFTIARP